MIIKGYVFVYLYLFGILGLTGLLKKVFNISDNSSRKVVHVMVSFSWVIMYKYLGFTIHSIIPPISFVIINYISVKKDTFSMMELHNEKKNYGTVYYALSFLILGLITLFNNKFIIPYGIGVFCMAFGDGFAAVVGRFFEKYNIKLINNKTLAGSITSFILSMLVVIIINCIFNVGYSVLSIFLIGLSSSILELISPKGTDNLTVPILVAVISYILL